MQNKIIIDNKTYFTEKFSGNSLKTLQAIQFTEKQIDELNRMIIFLERSKGVIIKKLSNGEF